MATCAWDLTKPSTFTSVLSVLSLYGRGGFQLLPIIIHTQTRVKMTQTKNFSMKLLPVLTCAEGIP